MTTTIQISSLLQRELTKRKLHERETYEAIVWDLLEDVSEVSQETKEEIARSRDQARQGKLVSLQQLMKELKR